MATSKAAAYEHAQNIRSQEASKTAKSSPRPHALPRRLSWHCMPAVENSDLDGLEHSPDEIASGEVLPRLQNIALRADAQLSSALSAAPVSSSQFVNQSGETRKSSTKRLVHAIDHHHVTDSGTGLEDQEVFEEYVVNELIRSSEIARNIAGKRTSANKQRLESSTISSSSAKSSESSESRKVSMNASVLDREQQSPVQNATVSTVSTQSMDKSRSLMRFSRRRHLTRPNLAKQETKYTLKEEKRRERELRQKWKNDANFSGSVQPTERSQSGKRRSDARKSAVGDPRRNEYRSCTDSNDSDAVTGKREISFGQFITALPSVRPPFHENESDFSSYFALESSIAANGRESRYAEEQRLAQMRLSCMQCGRSAARHALSQRKSCLPLCFRAREPQCESCSAAIITHRESTTTASDSSVSMS